MGKRDFFEYLVLSLMLMCVMVLYLGTLNPAFKNDDSPETTAAAFTLGIGHPPGYPLFTMAAKIFTIIPLASPAFRTNIFSSLLSMFVLLVAYFTAKNHIINCFISGGFWIRRILAFVIAIMLALSYIFWNQSTGAKGGIYILNLLFTSIIILYSLNIFQKYEIKYFYLISFIFGLGLVNHWMSIIILTPLLVYFFIKYRNELKIKGFIFSSLFVLIGLSAYLYLPIRANAGPDLNFGNPKTLQDFLWVVLRNAYNYPAKTGLDVYSYQLWEFLKFFFTNYSLFVLLAFIGAWAMLKTEKKTVWYLLGIFVIYIVVVVPYTRTIKGIFILEDILLIPAEYICLLFIAAGMSFIYTKVKQSKILLYFITIAVSGLLCFMTFRHYELNNDSGDYLSYDFGKSIMNTMEKDSVYFGDGDDNLMPVYYLREINNERKDIKFTASAFIMFQWGINDFISKYGNVPMQPLEIDNNIRNIIDSFINKTNIYRSSSYPQFDEMTIPYKQVQKGILIKVTPKNESFSSGIFDIYSYRGIYRRFCLQDPKKLSLITCYPAGMVNQANDLSNDGKLEDALRLYKLAMLFPVAKPEADIYFNMSIVYNKMKDYDNELDCLANAVKRNNKLLPAIERAGLLYYDCGILPLAKDMFTRAIELGNTSEKVKKALNNINSLNVIEQYEYGLNKANDYLLKQNYKKAMNIYNFLLDKNYKTAIIHRNIGLFYVKSGNFSEALNWFLKSKNKAQSPETIYYTAYSYYRIKNIKSALKELEDGLKLFNNDKGLNDLYFQLKKL